MKSKLFQKSIETKSSQEILDETNWVLDCVKKSGVKNGLVTVFSPHTTCAVGLNENESMLLQDMKSFLEKIAPSQAKYRHNEHPVDDRPNAHSHLQSLLLQASVSIPVSEGVCCMGSWQRVLFIELDGPRKERKLIVHVMGE